MSPGYRVHGLARLREKQKKTLGRKIQAQHHPRGCHKIRHFHFKADGSQTRCCHQQRRHPAQQNVEGQKEGRSRGQDSYRIPCNLPRRTSHTPAIHLQGVERSSNKNKILGPFRDHQIFPK